MKFFVSVYSCHRFSPATEVGLAMNWDEPREVKMIIKYKHRTENVEILKELKELKNTITLPQQHLQIMLSSWVTIVNGV